MAKFLLPETQFVSFLLAAYHFRGRDGIESNNAGKLTGFDRIARLLICAVLANHQGSQEVSEERERQLVGNECYDSLVELTAKQTHLATMICSLLHLILEDITSTGPPSFVAVHKWIRPQKEATNNTFRGHRSATQIGNGFIKMMQYEQRHASSPFSLNASPPRTCKLQLKPFSCSHLHSIKNYAQSQISLSTVSFDRFSILEDDEWEIETYVGQGKEWMTGRGGGRSRVMSERFQEMMFASHAFVQQAVAYQIAAFKVSAATLYGGEVITLAECIAILCLQTFPNGPPCMERYRLALNGAIKSAPFQTRPLAGF